MLTKRHFLIAMSATTAAVAWPTVTRATGSLRVAVALPGTINDNGWSQAAFDALTEARKRHGIEFAYTEKIKEPVIP